MITHNMCYQSKQYRLKAWSLLRVCLGTGLFGKGGIDFASLAVGFFCYFFFNLFSSVTKLFISTHEFCNFPFSYSPVPSPVPLGVVNEWLCGCLAAVQGQLLQQFT